MASTSRWSSSSDAAGARSTRRSVAVPRPLLEVGRIARPHGLRGEVVVELSTDRHERVEPGAELSTPSGPLVVASSRPFGRRWLVMFEGVSTREQADALRGEVLLAEALDDPEAWWVHELIGSV